MRILYHIVTVGHNSMQDENNIISGNNLFDCTLYALVTDLLSY